MYNTKLIQPDHTLHKQGWPVQSHKELILQHYAQAFNIYQFVIYLKFSRKILVFYSILCFREGLQFFDQFCVFEKKFKFSFSFVFSIKVTIFHSIQCFRERFQFFIQFPVFKKDYNFSFSFVFRRKVTIFHFLKLQIIIGFKNLMFMDT